MAKLTACVFVLHSVCGLGAYLPSSFQEGTPIQKRATTTGTTALVTGTMAPGGAEYLVTLNVGGQTFQEVFDTGSHVPWIPSNFIKPSGYQNTGETFEYFDVSHGKGSVYKGDVKLGSLDVKTQAFGVNASGTGPGTLGMAYPSSWSAKSSSGQTVAESTFLGNVLPSLSQPVFSVDLQRKPSPAVSANIYFGSIPPTFGTPSYTSILLSTDSYHWKFDVDSVWIGPDLTGGGLCNGWITDTGSTTLQLDTLSAEDYYMRVPSVQELPTSSTGMTSYTIDCNAILPDFTLYTTGGTHITITGQYIMGPPVSTGSQRCYGTIKMLPNDISFPCVLGQPLFHSNYVVFDHGNARLGFTAKPVS